MQLIVTEKPSVAMIFGKILSATERKDGYISDKEQKYIITWCVGHLIRACDPKDYDESLKQWKYSTLPIIPDNFKYKVNEKTEKQYKVIKTLMNKKEINEIICATDAGREGELIFRLVYNQSKSKKPVKRLWANSLEENALIKALLNVKDISEYENLYSAAILREQSDWLVGINASRAFSLQCNTLVSVGRVQTPILSIIAHRDSIIKNFKADTYYQVAIQDKNGLYAISEKIDVLEEANKVIEDCQNKTATVVKIEKEIKTEAVPKLFDLTSLQRECNKIFGFTAKNTLDTAQSLYEKKLITYPRTDSRFLPSDMKDKALKLYDKTIKKVEFVKDINIEPNIDYIIDDSKISDHFAIIITDYTLVKDLSELTDMESKVLYMIIQRFIASLSSKYVYENCIVTLDCNSHDFFIKHKKDIDLGFKYIESLFYEFFKLKEEKNNEKAQEYSEGQAFKNINAELLEKQTSAPKRYTEDTLLSVMENVTKTDYEDETTEKKGLGTPATRAVILEKLIDQGFIKRNKKQLLATEKAIDIVKLLPDYLKSPKMTADWETKLQQIEKGLYSKDKFYQEIKDFVIKITGDCIAVAESKSDIGNCPICNSKIIEDGKRFYCISANCTFSIWKESIYLTSKKIKLNKELFQKLLTDKKVYIENIYSEKKDKYYNAYLSFDESSFCGKYVNFKMGFE